MKQCSRGFTLIELLIVIVIIGILTTLLATNFIGARQRARDAKRKSELLQIQSALELYRADAGNYPTTDQFPSCGSAGGPLQGPSGGATYMQLIPCDSLTNRSYTYESDGSTYSIYACLENVSDSDLASQGVVDGVSGDLCPETGLASFTVNNP